MLTVGTRLFGSALYLFFFNDTATTEIYTLSYTTLFRSKTRTGSTSVARASSSSRGTSSRRPITARDRKSTRLNSSHGYISYAVFCLKKKKKQQKTTSIRSQFRVTKHTYHDSDQVLNPSK